MPKKLVGDPVSLYADDVVIVMRDLSQLKLITELIQQCGKYMGLTHNLQKTVMFSQTLQGDTQLHGVPIMSEPVKYLGAYLGDSSAAENKNFEHIVVKFKQIAKRWRECKLTIPARITVLKCMILSVAIHILSTTHNSSEQLQILQKMCNDFVWHGQN